MGSNSDDLKEVNWIINYVKIELDSFKNREADIYNVKYHESY